jgi:hypothetical protein
MKGEGGKYEGVTKAMEDLRKNKIKLENNWDNVVNQNKRLNNICKGSRLIKKTNLKLILQFLPVSRQDLKVILCLLK